MSRAENWSDAELSDYVDQSEDDADQPAAPEKRPEWEPKQMDDPDTGSTVQCPCGNRPTRQFARVFGDNSDKIVRCPDCATYRELKDKGAVSEDGSR